MLVYLGVVAVVAAVVARSGDEPSRPATPPRVQRAELAERFPRWRGLLQGYLRIDTTNPPGSEARAFPLLQSALSELGLTSTVTAMPGGRGNVWARLAAPSPDPGAGALILIHHIDVVPVERGSWSVDPFGGIEKDGKLWGRGAIDIKHLGVLQLAALDRLVKARERLRRDVVFLAVSDEEHGGSGAQLAVERDLAAWNAEYILDEGGFAVRSFMNDRDLVVVATTQKRITKLKLTAHGEAGHGSRPIPNGGPDVLRRALDRLADEPPPVRLVPTVVAQLENLGAIAGFPRQVLLERITWPGVLWALEGRLTRDKNLNPSLRDTMALTLLSAGQKDNVIPAEATATFDVRLLPDTNADDFLAHVKRVIGELPVTAELVQAPLPALEASSTDDPLYHAIEDAMRAHEPGAVVSPWLCVGATDSRFFVPRGVKSFGFDSVFLSKAQLDGIHGHDEHLDVAELEKGIVVYTEALERFLLR